MAAAAAPVMPGPRFFLNLRHLFYGDPAKFTVAFSFEQDLPVWLAAAARVMGYPKHLHAPRAEATAEKWGLAADGTSMLAKGDDVVQLLETVTVRFAGFKQVGVVAAVKIAASGNVYVVAGFHFKSGLKQEDEKSREAQMKEACAVVKELHRKHGARHSVILADANAVPYAAELQPLALTAAKTEGFSVVVPTACVVDGNKVAWDRLRGSYKKRVQNRGEPKRVKAEAKFVPNDFGFIYGDDPATITDFIMPPTPWEGRPPGNPATEMMLAGSDHAPIGFTVNNELTVKAFNGLANHLGGRGARGNEMCGNVEPCIRDDCKESAEEAEIAAQKKLFVYGRGEPASVKVAPHPFPDKYKNPAELGRAIDRAWEESIRQELKALGDAATYKDVVEKRLVVVEPTATRAPPAAVGI